MSKNERSTALVAKVATPTTKVPMQCVLVRKDLPVMVQAIHIGHATREALRVAPCDKRTKIRAKHVGNEAELREYAEKLEQKGFHIGLVIENEGPFAGQATALATEPLTEQINALNKIVFKLPRADSPIAPCSVCAGEPSSTASPCICGGTGSFEGEVIGLRKRVIELETVTSKSVAAFEAWADLPDPSDCAADIPTDNEAFDLLLVAMRELGSIVDRAGEGKREDVADRGARS